MPPDMSGQESNFVVKILERIFGEGNVSEHFIRKLAHFTEYFVFGMEIMLYMGKFDICLFHGVFTAAVDETIQIFSLRGSSLIDVWLDTAGCILGITLIYIILRKKTKSGRASEDY